MTDTTTTAAPTTSFEVGKTYYTRSICDHDCIYAVTVASRTAKTIVTSQGKRFRPRLYKGVECFNPRGDYSMAPVISADQPLPEGWDVQPCC